MKIRKELDFLMYIKLSFIRNKQNLYLYCESRSSFEYKYYRFKNMSVYFQVNSHEKNI